MQAHEVQASMILAVLDIVVYKSAFPTVPIIMLLDLDVCACSARLVRKSAQPTPTPGYSLGAFVEMNGTVVNNYIFYTG